jgi:hypothetical protein
LRIAKFVICYVRDKRGILDMKIAIALVNFLGSICKNNAKKTLANWFCARTSLQIISIVA